MTRQEFLIAATLKLMATRKENETMDAIAKMASEITDLTFASKVKIEDEEKKDGQWWLDDVDKQPIMKIVDFVKTYSYSSGGYGVRLENIFNYNHIGTVGDLLRYGRHGFSRLKDVGKGSVTRIDDALDELFKIKSW